MTQIDASLAAALAGGLSQEQAAVACGTSRSTVGRKLRDPAFQARVDELAAAHARRLAQRLAQLADRAVDTLGDVLATAESDSARVSAARTVLTSALAFEEAGELEARLAALETRSNGHAVAWPSCASGGGSTVWRAARGGARARRRTNSTRRSTARLSACSPR